MPKTTASVDFGYLPLHFHAGFDGLELSVVNTPNLCALIQAADDEWVYTAYPQSRQFGMPKTHTLMHTKARGLIHLQFIIWCYGFFRGIRLTTEEAGFVDCTRLRTGQLDFVPTNFRDANMLQYFSDFWIQNEKNINYYSIESIIHLVFLAENPRLFAFEEFHYRYTALDACYALLKKDIGDVKHARRTAAMCKHIGIDTPTWAQQTIATDGIREWTTSEIANARNPAVHEGLFYDQPLGFAHDIFPRDTIRQMGKLVNRILVFILLGQKKDKSFGYVESDVKDRHKIGLDLSESFQLES